MPGAPHAAPSRALVRLIVLVFLLGASGLALGACHVRGPFADPMRFPTLLTDFDGTLYFLAGRQLWRSDGTTAGTVVVPGSPSDVGTLARVGSKLYFNANGE
jgi:ELWxxDGT repeat protein